MVFRLFVRVVSGALLVLMTGLLVVSAVLRELGSPVIGIVEIVGYAMLALASLSLAPAQVAGSHIVIRLVTDRFPAPVQRVFALVSHATTSIVAMTVALIYAFTNNWSDSSHIATGLLNIPPTPFQAMIVAGFAAWSIAAALDFWAVLRGREEKVGGHENEL